MASKPKMDNFAGNPGMPLTKETETTYGGTKPGKAPTVKAPKAPDPFALIEAQGRENRVNEVGPSGSTIYGRDPKTGVWTANRSFSPELQGLFDKQVDLAGQDPNAYNESIAEAMFGRQKAMLDPVFSEQDRALEQKLANQGLPMGSEAYTGERNRFDRTRNEAYESASRDATIAGTQTGISQRQSEFNQLAALLGGQQVGPTAPIDVTGPFQNQYQGQLNSVNSANAAGAARNAQTTSGAASLASMLAMVMMCSKDFKDNNEPIDHGQTLDGVNSLTVEAWTYKGDDQKHIGPYAEEFRKTFGLGSEFVIDPIDAVGVCLSAIKALTKRVENLEAGHA